MGNWLAAWFQNQLDGPGSELGNSGSGGGPASVAAATGAEVKEYRARAAVTTLPLSLLQASPGTLGAVQWAGCQ
jgi:hypothetical protein